MAIEDAQAFEVKFDFTDESIHKLEEILDYYSVELSNSIKGEEPTEKQIFSMASIWGVYLGEVMRIKVGKPCKWIYVYDELLLSVNGAEANPIGKAYKRIVNGSEDSVISFYHIITSELINSIK